MFLFSKNKWLLVLGMVLLPGKRIFYGEEFRGYKSNGLVTDSLPGLLRLNTQLYGGSGRRKLSFTDWDGDGRKDILINSGNVTWLKNKGKKDGKIYSSDEGQLSDWKIAGHSTSPTVVDRNKDQIPDLRVGAEDGYFFIWKIQEHNKDKSSENDKIYFYPYIVDHGFCDDHVIFYGTIHLCRTVGLSGRKKGVDHACG